MTIPPPGTPVPARLVCPGDMAKILACSTATLRRYRDAGVFTRGVYKKKGFVRYDPAQILDQMRES